MNCLKRKPSKSNKSKAWNLFPSSRPQKSNLKLIQTSMTFQWFRMSWTLSQGNRAEFGSRTLISSVALRACKLFLIQWNTRINLLKEFQELLGKVGKPLFFMKTRKFWYCKRFNSMKKAYRLRISMFCLGSVMKKVRRFKSLNLFVCFKSSTLTSFQSHQMWQN